MISNFKYKFNNFNQKEYENYINKTNYQAIECKCGRKGNYVKHGYYIRYLKYLDRYKIKIRILRVKCKSCGRTHAVLPSFVVPYNQISLDDILIIIEDYEKTKDISEVINNNCDYEDYDIKRVIRIYKTRWKERLKALNMSIETIVYETLVKMYKMMFMQNKMNYYNC